MAAPVDIGLLQIFYWIFPMILIFGVAYSFLIKSKLIESKMISGFIAFAFAISILFVPVVIEILKYALPWLVLLFVFIMAVLMVFIFIAGEDVKTMITEGIKAGSYWWLIFIIVSLIFIGAIAKVFLGAQVPETLDTPMPSENIQTASTSTYSFWGVLSSPNVLGMLFVMILGVFMIVLLTGSDKKV